MSTKQLFILRLNIFRCIINASVQASFQFSRWLDSKAIEIVVSVVFLYHVVQCVPLPWKLSKFRIPHWFLLGLLGKLSRVNTPRNEGMCSFLTEAIISKLVKGLFGSLTPSSEIKVVIILFQRKKISQFN